MAEIWGRSDLSPATKSVFNWKIENFQRMLKILGQTGFYSPIFKVVGFDGKMHSLKLRVTQFTSTSYKGYSVTGVSEPGSQARPMGEVVPFQVDVAYIPLDLMLAGTIEMELNGQTILGSIGKAEQDKFERTITSFTNQTYPVTIKTSSKNFEADSIFCVATTQDALEMKVQLSTPGNLTCSTSLLYTNDQTVKQVGESRLLSDIKALLTSVDNYADFNIVCEGKNFPCHEAILRARSPVFDKMFLQKLKEWTTREMIMEDVKKETVGHLLEYIYTGEVTKTVEKDAELIYVADKYHIAGLMELCLRKLPEVEDNKVVDILILADRHNLEDFKKLSMQRILKDKNKFLKDEDFVTKLNGTPHILMDFFKL